MIAHTGDNREAPGRIAELDGIRGVAVLMVLAWHLVGEIVKTSEGPWAWWLNKVTVVGRTGVDLFFVLSGLLITGIILDRTHGIGGFLSAFYKRRVLRIVPPYAALLLLYYGLRSVGVFIDTSGISPWNYITFTQTWWMALNGQWGPPELSVTWSVSIEEHYYLLFPALLVFVPKKSVPLILLAIAAVSASIRPWLFFGLQQNTYYAYVFPASRLDALALGGLVAWLIRNEAVAIWCSRYQREFWSGALVILLLIEVLIGIALHRSGPFHMFSWGHLTLAIGFSLLLFALLLNAGKSCCRILRCASLRKAGVISYSLYLFHPLALILMFKVVGRSPTLGNLLDCLLVAGTLAGTVLFCGALLPFEKRAISCGRRYSY